MIGALLVSLGLTVALELPVARLWGVRLWRDLALVVLVNVLTNPPVVLGYYLIASATHWPWYAVQLPLEALAVAVEALCYCRCGRQISKPVGLAICANGFSYGMGLVLAALL